jgi:hypothetical protein
VFSPGGAQTIAKNSFGQAVATCPAGKKVIGGGEQLNNNNFQIVSSYPTVNQEWTVLVRNTAPQAQTGTVIAEAICAVVQ